MYFLDPQDVVCTECGYEGPQRVRALLRLEAQCPECQTSFRDVGIHMREMMDRCARMFHTLDIIVSVERRLKILIRESIFQIPVAEEQRTIGDLIKATSRALEDKSLPVSQAEPAILTAIREEIPEAPDPPSLDDPLLFALEPNRWKDR